MNSTDSADRTDNTDNTTDAMPTNHTSGTAPFAGLTVIEISNSVAAPFAGQIFSELGARLVKVEKPSGDDARGWARRFGRGRLPTSRR